jgi:uncharacterized membrane protein HdeD (DUF308 family)
MKIETMRKPGAILGIAVIDVGTLARNWWVVLLRGVAGIIFGLATFFAPEISLTVLVLVFGAYAFLDGILALISAIRRRGTTDHWWLLVLEGVMGVAVGVLTFVWPNITALALLYLIAAWALITGGLEIAAAIRLRKVITGEWLLVLSGIASVALGVLLILFPEPGALAVVLWIGAYALVSGVLLIALGIRLRSWAKSLPVAP